MANDNNDLLLADVRMASRRLGASATAEQMLRWINHHLRRKYDLRAFEVLSGNFKSQSKKEYEKYYELTNKF